MAKALMMAVVLMVLWTGPAAGQSAEACSKLMSNAKCVSAATWINGEWPYTIDGILMCVPSGPFGAAVILFRPKGNGFEVWPVNRVAKGKQWRDNMLDGGVRVEASDEPIRIMDTSAVVSFGLALCDR